MFVYIKFEWKFFKLVGRFVKDFDLDVEDWVIDMRDYIVNILINDEKIEFVLDYFIGNVKMEIWMCLFDMKKIVDDILKIVEEIFKI